VHRFEHFQYASDGWKSASASFKRVVEPPPPKKGKK